MVKGTKKKEALSVSRLINEVLVAQLSIPFRQIVNDATFSKYTGSKRPDLLISEFEYDGTNDDQYIKNLVAYAEAKDDCKVDDKDWKDALKQGKIKAPKLGLPYFIVTNCKTTYFYNAKTLRQLTLNGNPIREFQTIDIYRLIKNKLTAINPMTGEELRRTKDVLVYGISDNQFAIICEELPSSDIRVVTRQMEFYLLGVRQTGGVMRTTNPIACLEVGCVISPRTVWKDVDTSKNTQICGTI